MKRSHLGTVEGLEGFNFSLRPQLEPRVVKELLNCRFIQENRNIICVGKPGLGKTRIAKAIAHAACLRGYSVLFVIAIDLLEDLHASLADGSFKRTFHRYTQPSVVVIDELGYEGLNSKHANYLYRLVSARYGRGSVIITANVGFSKWATFFPFDSQAVPTVDRLLDRATILRFTGKSFREPAEIHGAPLDEYYIDVAGMSFVRERMLPRSREIADLGLSYVVSAGWMPGITELLPVYAHAGARAKMDVIESLTVYFSDSGEWSATALRDGIWYLHQVELARPGYLHKGEWVLRGELAAIAGKQSRI